MFPVFVYEWTCCRRAEVGSLAAEGWAMLSAVLEDFRVAGVPPVTLLHETFPLSPPGVGERRIREVDEEEAFRNQVRQTSATLVIAPEFDGLLAERCRWVEEEQRPLLGPSSEAVSLSADKLRLSQHLHAHGVPTPRSGLTPGGPYPLVLKPRDGAGSQATFLVRSEDEFHAARIAAREEGWRGELIAQPFVPGRAVSAAVLLGPGVETVLPPAEQHLSGDGRFRYRGGVVPLPDDLAARAAALASRGVRTVPGLAGYVGVDMVLGDSGDFVIEINPRLTTSYVGLRKLTPDNLAWAMLEAVRGVAVPLRWRTGPVRFTADGQSSESSS